MGTAKACTERGLYSTLMIQGDLPTRVSGMPAGHSAEVATGAIDGLTHTAFRMHSAQQ